VVVEVVVEGGDGAEVIEVTAAVLPVIVEEGVGGGWRWESDVACHG